MRRYTLNSIVQQSIVGQTATSKSRGRDAPPPFTKEDERLRTLTRQCLLFVRICDDGFVVGYNRIKISE